MSQLGRAVPAAPMIAPPGARRAVRPDPVAALLLLAAGVAGVWQLFLPWFSVTPPGPGPGGPAATGWQVYRGLRLLPDPPPDLRWATLAVLGCAVAGGALVVLGLAVLAPINHRPLGVAAVLISLLAVTGALWVVVHARPVFDLGVFGLFGQATTGFYLFLGSGLVGLLGAGRAMAGG